MCVQAQASTLGVWHVQHVAIFWGHGLVLSLVRRPSPSLDPALSQVLAPVGSEDACSAGGRPEGEPQHSPETARPVPQSPSLPVLVMTAAPHGGKEGTPWIAVHF